MPTKVVKLERAHVHNLVTSLRRSRDAVAWLAHGAEGMTPAEREHHAKRAKQLHRLLADIQKGMGEWDEEVKITVTFERKAKKKVRLHG